MKGMRFIMLKAVIFDMDGVLIDSEPVHAKACVKALESINIKIPLSYCYKFIGSTTAFMLHTIIEEYQVPKTVEELLSLYHSTLDEIIKTEGHIPIPHVLNTIKDLYNNGVKLAIASSSSETEIKDVAEYLGIINCFDKLVSGTTVTNPKPAPDVFLKAVNELGVNPFECLIIEDSYNGLTAGNSAGIPVIGFVNENSGKQDLSKAFYIIEGFEEIDYNFLNKVYKRFYKEPVTISETPRLFIRELCEHDIADLLEILYDIQKSTQSRESFFNIDNLDLNPNSKNKSIDAPVIYKNNCDIIKSYINNIYPFYDYGLWGVYLKANNKLIGLSGIQLIEKQGNSAFEISYLIDTAYQGNNLGVEAVKAILQYGLTKLSLDKIIAYILPDNIKSIKTASSAGMHLECSVNLNNKEYLLYVIKRI